MTNLLPPRDFSDFTVPLRSYGSLLLQTQSEEDCQAYLRWISDYLHEIDPPLSPDQEDWLIEHRPSANGASGVSFGISLRFLSQRPVSESEVLKLIRSGPLIVLIP